MQISFLNLFVFLESFFLMVIGALYAYSLYQKESELKKNERELQRKADHLIEQARHESESILHHAMKKAEEMIDKTDAFKSEIESQFTKSLSEKSLDAANTFTDVFNKIQEKYILDARSSFSKLEEESRKGMNEFQFLLKNEGMYRKSFIEEKMEDEYKKVKEEIKRYKEVQMKEFSELISSRANELALQVLGKSISLKEHEKLIMEAIEKAKTEGLFA